MNEFKGITCGGTVLARGAEVAVILASGP